MGVLGFSRGQREKRGSEGPTSTISAYVNLAMLTVRHLVQLLLGLKYLNCKITARHSGGK